jgi:hypothetical protein
LLLRREKGSNNHSSYKDFGALHLFLFSSSPIRRLRFAALRMFAAAPEKIRWVIFRHGLHPWLGYRALSGL